MSAARLLPPLLALLVGFAAGTGFGVTVLDDGFEVEPSVSATAPGTAANRSSPGAGAPADGGGARESALA